jgi:hypothetical protein
MRGKNNFKNIKYVNIKSLYVIDFLLWVIHMLHLMTIEASKLLRYFTSI